MIVGTAIEAVEDKAIYDKIAESIYWYDCQECDFKTDDYLKQYHHKAKTEHIVKIKSVALKYLDSILS